MNQPIMQASDNLYHSAANLGQFSLGKLDELYFGSFDKLRGIAKDYICNQGNVSFTVIAIGLFILAILIASKMYLSKNIVTFCSLFFAIILFVMGGLIKCNTLAIISILLLFIALHQF